MLHKEGPSEAAQRAGGRLHGLQLWVNLPLAQDDGPGLPGHRRRPGRRHVRGHGRGSGHRGHAVRLTGPGSTHTPISYAHVTLAPDSSVTTTLPAGHNVLVYPMTGSLRIGATTVPEKTAVVDGARITLDGDPSGSGAAEVIVLTGEPIGEPVARYGPFVMNTMGEIRQAFEDYQAGRFGTPGT